MKNEKFTLIVAGVEVEVTRKQIRHVYLRVVPPFGDVKVSAPEHMRQGEIAAFVAGKMKWIREKQKAYEGNAPRMLLSGDTVLLWGNPYVLIVSEDKSNAKKLKFSYYINNGQIFIDVSGKTCVEDREKILSEIYREEVKRKLETLIPEMEKKTGLKASVWKVKNMKSRWGSCKSSDGTIAISSRLGMYPQRCLEVVMIHELMHFRVHGHGRDFYDLMDRYAPDWKEIKKILKGN